MKFSPCVDNCTYEGTHCQGCGRSHEEIAETKKIVANLVNFVQDQGYDNPDEFVSAVGQSVLKKLKKLSA